MIDFPNRDPLSIALSLWNIGLVSETALMAWADARILDRVQPCPDLLELAASGAQLCLQRDSIESRPFPLTFVEEFALRSHLLDLSDARSTIHFIDWVSRNCGGEDLEHPVVLFVYELDHLYYELDDLPAAIELLRSELPLLLPSCEIVASAFLEQVPDLVLISPTGDANEGQSAPINEIDRHPIDLTPAAIRQLLNHIEIELLPLMLAGFERNPQAMLGGSLRELHNAIGYAVALELPHVEIQRYVNLFHTVALCHLRFGTGDAPFTANIDGNMLDFMPEAHSERMGVDTWADAIHACAIVGDRDGIRLLTTFDEDVFADSDGACSPFDLAYYRFWVDFSNGGQNTAKLLDLAIALAAQEDNLRGKFVNSIRLPELRLLEAIGRGDTRAFHERILNALAAHKQFWSQPSHVLQPSGWVAFPLLAACAIATCWQDFSIAKRTTKAIDVKSDYLPQFMINHRADLLTIVRCQTCNRSSDLTLQAERFWCAWCQNWATIQLDRVKDLEIDRMLTLPQLASQHSTQIPLQPLRIPTGWHVAYNNGLFEIDPLPELFADENPWWIFKEDMLQMYNERFNRLLDLGWYPEGDLVAGSYGLVVYEGDFRGRLLYEFRTRDRLELVAEIERLLSEICQEKL